jgi:hypothetical protein
VVHTGQQVDRAAVGGGPFGAAQGLAVDGDRPPAGGGSARLPLSLLAAQPGADGAGQDVGVQARQGSADGGLGRDAAVVGAIAAGPERGPDRLGCVGGPFGDRGDRPRPGQHRGGRQAQDPHQRVAAATGNPRVGDAGQAGEQVWGSRSWKGSAWASGARAAAIGDDGSAGTGVRPGHEIVVAA